MNILDYQTRRYLTDRTMVFLCGAAAFIATIPLAFVLYFVVTKGFKLISGAGIFVLALAAAVYLLFYLHRWLKPYGAQMAAYFLIPLTVLLAFLPCFVSWKGFYVMALLSVAYLLFYLDRRLKSFGVRIGAYVLTPLTCLLTLGLLFLFVKADFSFFLQTPRPVGEPGGGMANAIVGTLEIILIASLVGLPIGIMAGIYLSEFGKKNGFAWAVRFTCDVLSGVPSIVTGIVAYTLIVRLVIHHFSGIAGGVALGLMMIPIVTRTTEELVNMVPHSIREASWALGVSQWKTILNIVIRTAKNGILTGVLLSIARVAGETAPLLFTALGNVGFSNPVDPTAALTVQVYTYAISPFEDWRNQAWTGALVLLILVLTMNLAAKMFFKNPRNLLR